MARKNAPPSGDEDFRERESESSSRSRFDDSPLDARTLDLDEEAESPFLRGQKRIPVRRGVVPRKTAGRLKLLLGVGLVVGMVGFVSLALYRYGATSWRFRLDSSDDIEVVGSSNVSRGQIMDVMGGDIDRNVFFVPLVERKKQLEAIPWVQSAAVMRFLPNHLKVVVNERVPVAFVEMNSRIALIDRNGVIMEMAPGEQASYSFPVIVGMLDSEPLSTRSSRMKVYMQLIHELDASGAHYSHDLSDVDLSDPDDVKATVVDPHGAVLVHLGTMNFLERFKIYVAHVEEWRAQFVKLQSVDLRYEHQVIVNPDVKAAESQSSNLAANSSAPAQGASSPHKSSAPRSKGKKHT